MKKRYEKIIPIGSHVTISLKNADSDSTTGIVKSFDEEWVEIKKDDSALSFLFYDNIGKIDLHKAALNVSTSKLKGELWYDDINIHFYFDDMIEPLTIKENIILLSQTDKRLANELVKIKNKYINYSKTNEKNSLLDIINLVYELSRKYVHDYIYINFLILHKEEIELNNDYGGLIDDIVNHLIQKNMLNRDHNLFVLFIRFLTEKNIHNEMYSLLIKSGWNSDMIEASIYFLLKNGEKSKENDLKKIYLNFQNNILNRNDHEKIKSLYDELKHNAPIIIEEKVSPIIEPTGVIKTILPDRNITFLEEIGSVGELALHMDEIEDSLLKQRIDREINNSIGQNRILTQIPIIYTEGFDPMNRRAAKSPVLADKRTYKEISYFIKNTLRPKYSYKYIEDIINHFKFLGLSLDDSLLEIEKEINETKNKTEERTKQSWQGSSKSVAETDNLFKNSKILKDEIDNFENLQGFNTKAYSRQQGKFNHKQLKTFLDEIFKSINDRTIVNNPTMKANLLLSEIKIKYDSNFELGTLKIVCARYLITKGQSYKSSDSSLVRSYFFELFKLENNMDFYIQPLLEYLYSFSYDFDSIKNLGVQNIQYSDGQRIFGEKFGQMKKMGLRECFDEHDKDNKDKIILWDSLIEISINCNMIKNHVFEQINNSTLSEYFSKYLISLNIENTDFIQLVDKRKKNNNDLISHINNLCKSKKINEFILNYEDINKKLKTIRGLRKIDKNNIKSFIVIISISQKLLEAREEYTTSNNYQNEINELLARLQKRLKDKPSSFSYEYLTKIIEKFELLLDDYWNTFLSDTKPKIDIKLASDIFVIDEIKKTVLITIMIENNKGRSSIDEIKLRVVPDNDNIEILKEGTTELYLQGGDQLYIDYIFKLDENIIDKKAFDIKCEFSYREQALDKNKILSKDLPVNLDNEGDFGEINNPYSEYSTGTQVHDSKMFYGRTEIVSKLKNKIINSPTSVNHLLFGQKRSGKSSVLHHLKKSMEDTNILAVSFSLGEITENLNINKFYYYLLENISSTIVNKYDDYPIKDYTNMLEEKYPDIFLKKELQNIREHLLEKYNCINICLLIDEFQYIYDQIKKDSLSDTFMKNWKSFIESNLFSCVLFGQDTMTRFTEEYPNEFASLEKTRLDYLDFESSIQLIDEPIYDTIKEKSRYFDKGTICMIYDFTAGNPFYLQKVCDRLVDSVNKNKIPVITKATINNIFTSFINGIDSLTAGDFDNLLNPGDQYLENISKEDKIIVLKQIAEKNKLGVCNMEDLDPPETASDDELKEIVNDLNNRTIIYVDKGNLKIKVKLFEQWLLNQS